MGKSNNKGKHQKGAKRYKGKTELNNNKKVIKYRKEEKEEKFEEDAFVPKEELKEPVSLEEILDVVRNEIKGSKNFKKQNKKKYKEELDNTSSVKKENKKKNKKEDTKEKKKDKKKDKKKEKKPSKAKKIIITIIQIILIGVIVYSGYKIYIWYRDNQENNEIKEELVDAVTVSDEISNEDGSLDAKNYEIDFEKLKQTNKEVVGWLKVNNTNIEYPIVYTNNNEYYLDHSFNRNINGAGWPFLDYHEKLDGTDKNLVIYGHNRKDASMFGTLQDTLKPEWYENKANKNIVYITPTEKSNYEVFSVYRIQVEDYYITTQFNNIDFGNFAQRLKKRSAYDFGVEVGKDDTIITLSTCSGNEYRTVLHAKKVVEDNQIQ